MIVVGFPRNVVVFTVQASSPSGQIGGLVITAMATFARRTTKTAEKMVRILLAVENSGCRNLLVVAGSNFIYPSRQIRCIYNGKSICVLRVFTVSESILHICLNVPKTLATSR